jgi:hypothetical protein
MLHTDGLLKAHSLLIYKDEMTDSANDPFIETI